MNLRTLGGFLLLSACTLSVPAWAQREMVTLDGPPKGGLEGVITAGLNASQVDGDGRSGFKLPGLYLGVAAKFHFNQEWALGPEFLYSEKGAQTSTNDEATQIHFKIRNRYIEIPVLAHYTPNGTSPFTISLGFSVAYLLYSRGEYGDATSNTLNRWTRVDFSAVGGFEYKLIDRLSLMARWTYSINPNNSNYIADPSVQTSANNIFVQGAGVRNNTISVALRYNIPYGNR